MARVNQVQLAEAWNVSKQRVNKMVKDGVLTVGDDGLIDEDEANEARSNLSLDHMERQHVLKEANGGKGNMLPTAFMQARTMTAVINAKRAQLEHDEALGKLVKREDVEHQAFQIGRVFNQTVGTWSARLGREIVHVARSAPSDEVAVVNVMEIINREVRHLLSTLTTGLSSLLSNSQSSA